MFIKIINIILRERKINPWKEIDKLSVKAAKYIIEMNMISYLVLLDLKGLTLILLLKKIYLNDIYLSKTVRKLVKLSQIDLEIQFLDYFIQSLKLF